MTMFMTWELLFQHSFSDLFPAWRENCHHWPMVSSPPQVNYVLTHCIPTSTDDQFSDVVHHVLGSLEPNLSFMTSYELWFKVDEDSFLPCVNLINKWNKGHEDSSFTVSTSLKNEIGPWGWFFYFVNLVKKWNRFMSIVPHLVSTSLENETKDMRIVFLLCQPC